MRRFLKFAFAHKITTLIVLAGLAYGGYAAYRSANPPVVPTQYVTSPVTKGTLVSSVSGTGQVSNKNRLDMTFGASGTVVSVSVKNGATVKKGQVLAKLDSTDVARSVRDAKSNLEAAQISLNKLVAPPSDLDVLTAKNAVTTAQNDLANANQALSDSKQALSDAYDNLYDTTASTFTKLPTVESDLHDVLYSSTVNGSSANIDAYADIAYKYDTNAYNRRDEVVNLYNTAQADYQTALTAYNELSRSSSDQAKLDAAKQTNDAVLALSEAIKRSLTFIDYVDTTLSDRLLAIPKALPGNQDTLKSDTTTVLGLTDTLTNAIDGIDTAKQNVTTKTNAIGNAQLTLKEKEQNYSDLIAGPDPFDVQQAQLSVKQKQEAVADAESNYANYELVAPFDGVVSNINIDVSQSVSGSTTAMTVATPQKIADVSLNEVDVANVKVGQHATLTFDAVPDYTATGEVIEVDDVGTTSQGVVSYGVQIAFDGGNAKVKSGMSVTANIVTSVGQESLLVPLAAVKTQGSTSYVEVLGSDNKVTQVDVTTGHSNDTTIEVTSDKLKEGDNVVTRTDTSGATTTTTQQGGGRRGGMFMPGVGRIGG